MFEITSGVQIRPQKVVIYGPEGIGKSSFAAQFPEPLFIDTEGGTGQMNVRRLPAPQSWAMLAQEVDYVKRTPELCKTLVIDTVDWAERLCIEYVCAKGNVSGIEDFGYGKGYTYLWEEFGRFLNVLSDLIEQGINVVLTAHAEIKKIEQPEEIGGYDHWQMKLQKGDTPLVKEWADMILFANFKTLVVNVDNQGAAKGKNKAQGAKRVMYTSHHACWDAKNRHGLKDELPLDYKEIAHVIDSVPLVQSVSQFAAPAETAPEIKPQPPEEMFTDSDKKLRAIEQLQQLCDSNNVHPQEIMQAVGRAGYYPEDTPIPNYKTEFILSALIGDWSALYQNILQNRKAEI